MVIEIGESVGSCGTAAFTKKRVIVSDILTHPYWIKYRELAQQAGLKSCWSEPIISSDDKVLGTFAIYHREPKLPDQEDLNHLKTAMDFASLAIERGQTEAEIIKHREHLEELVEERTLALKESEERFRIFFNSGSDIIFVSELKEKRSLVILLQLMIWPLNNLDIHATNCLKCLLMILMPQE